MYTRAAQNYSSTHIRTCYDEPCQHTQVLQKTVTSTHTNAVIERESVYFSERLNFVTPVAALIHDVAHVHFQI